MRHCARSDIIGVGIPAIHKHATAGGHGGGADCGHAVFSARHLINPSLDPLEPLFVGFGEEPGVGHDVARGHVSVVVGHVDSRDQVLGRHYCLLDGWNVKERWFTAPFSLSDRQETTSTGGGQRVGISKAHKVWLEFAIPLYDNSRNR